MRSKSDPSWRVRLKAFQPTRTMKSAWLALCLRKRCRLGARAKLRSPMRISARTGAPRFMASAPWLSVSSKCEKPPTGRLAARLAKATAVASTQAASGPTHSRTRSLVRQLASHHGVQELDRLVAPILHRWIAHLGQAEHRRPGGGLAQRQATRAAGQRQAQQVSATVERTPALDRLGLSGEAVKIE